MSRKKAEALGSMLPLPLQFLAAWLGVWFARACCTKIGSTKNEASQRLLKGRMDLPSARKGVKGSRAANEDILTFLFAFAAPSISLRFFEAQRNLPG